MNDVAPEAEGQAVDAAPVSEGQADTGASNAVWYDNAPDEVKGYIQNKGWDDPIKAVQSYQELEKFKGANENELIRLPKDMKAEGALDDVYKRLGRPESPDKYELSAPEGVELNKELLQEYAGIAHKYGMTNDGFQELATKHFEIEQKAIAAYQEEQNQKYEAEYQQLRKDWGKQADEREELSRRGLRSLMPEGVDKDDVVSKIEGAIGTAMTLKLFANAGDNLAREHRIHDSSGDRPYGYSREQATSDRKTLMNELSSNPERLKAYNNGAGNDYEKMQRLNKIIAGQG